MLLIIGGLAASSISFSANPQETSFLHHHSGSSSSSSLSPVNQSPHSQSSGSKTTEEMTGVVRQVKRPRLQYGDGAGGASSSSSSLQTEDSKSDNELIQKIELDLVKEGNEQKRHRLILDHLRLCIWNKNAEALKWTLSNRYIIEAIRSKDHYIFNEVLLDLENILSNNVLIEKWRVIWELSAGVNSLKYFSRKDLVGKILSCASASDYHNLIAFVVDSFERMLDDNNVDYAFHCCIISGSTKCLNIMLDRGLKAHQQIVEVSILNTTATGESLANTMRIVFQTEALRPSDSAIVNIYNRLLNCRPDDAGDYNSIRAGELARIIENYLPTEEAVDYSEEDHMTGIQNREYMRRIVEVHNFSCNKDKILQIMEHRLSDAGVKESDYLLYKDALAMVRSSAAKHAIVLPGKFELYTSTADMNCQNTLELSATFVSKFYKESFDAWVKGFLDDSADAHKDFQAPPVPNEDMDVNYSCQQGFWERMTTCLDRIDNDLLTSRDKEISSLLGGDQLTLMLEFKVEHFVNPLFVARELKKLGVDRILPIHVLNRKMKDILCSKFEEGKELEEAERNLLEKERYGFWDHVYEEIITDDQAL